jgi:hypothetical protein
MNEEFQRFIIIDQPSTRQHLVQTITITNPFYLPRASPFKLQRDMQT